MKKVLIIAALVSIAISLIIFFSKNSPQNSPQETQTKTDIQTREFSNIPKNCTGNVIPQLTEGPYYTPDSPERQDIRDDATGEQLILEGYVFDTDCKPITGAWIDFWQADGNGNYDNTSYSLRGHQFTDEKGYYKLISVVPTRYTGRTEHIHFKIRASNESPIITSQLFFPDSTTNETDSIFNETLIVTMGEESGGSKQAYFNFVIER